MTADSETQSLSQTEGLVLWRITVCRGKDGNCPFALTNLSDLKERIEDELRSSDWRAFWGRRGQERVLSHHVLKIALAACPNACSRPQIQDIGLVAALRPTDIQETCTACGQCQRICREDAIEVNCDIAQLNSDACIACGECIAACPIDAIETEPLHFRIMLGGRMGRHPKWATELPGKWTSDEVTILVGNFVSVIINNARTGERVSDLLERLGMDHVRKAIGPVSHE